VPRLKDTADLTGLPLMPREGFVLSLIDGTTTADELADLSGLDRSDIIAILGKLSELGVLEWTEAPAPSPSQRPPGSGPTRAGRSGRSPSGGPARPASSAPSGRSPTPVTVRTEPTPPSTPRSLYDPAELEEPDVDLPVERRRVILDRYYRLTNLDHYQVLGISREAKREEIRAAYFEQSKQFHPDTLFRKRLGSFRQKMEGVFKRLTEAYETLSKKSRRAEYDAYLKARDQTRAAAAALAKGARDAEAIAQRSVAAPEPRAPVGGADAPGPPTVDAGEPPLDPMDDLSLDPPDLGAGSDAGGATPETPPPPTSSSPDPAAKARARELAARRLHSLLGNRRRPPSAPRPTPPKNEPAAPTGAGSSPPPPGSGSGPSASRQRALRGLASSLRQVAEVTGGVDRVARHLKDARAAEATGDLVSAANSLLRALAVAPERDDIKAEHARLRKAVAGRLAETYERQARYEEENGHWREAAESWTRVADGRPGDPAPRVAAAEALLVAGKDIPQAKLLAEEGVALAPDDLRARRTLARVYIAAGLTKNARRELEAARKLDPADRIVNNLLDELQG